MAGWDLDVGDLVKVRESFWQRPSDGNVGIITRVIVPRKQWEVFWINGKQHHPTVMYGLIEPVWG